MGCRQQLTDFARAIDPKGRQLLDLADDYAMGHMPVLPRGSCRVRFLESETNGTGSRFALRDYSSARSETGRPEPIFLGPLARWFGPRLCRRAKQRSTNLLAPPKQPGVQACSRYRRCRQSFLLSRRPVAWIFCGL